MINTLEDQNKYLKQQVKSTEDNMNEVKIILLFW